MAIRPVPVTFAEANNYVDMLHRHNGRLPSARLVVGIADMEGQIRGVAIAGLPKARMLMERGTLEINRVCTDGVRNGCSMLYAAITRAAKALGYTRIITYTLESESGASLRASGWTAVETWSGGSWTEGKARPTGDDSRYDTGPKVRWEIRFGGPIGNVIFPETEDAHPTLFAGMRGES